MYKKIQLEQLAIKGCWCDDDDNNDVDKLHRDIKYMILL